MTEKERIGVRVLQSQINNLQRRHDQFWRQAVEAGWTENDALKRQLMGYQHDVSSSVYNAQATVNGLLSGKYK